MKWDEPQEGDIREKEGFLWFPQTIQYETRWLEHAVWLERYTNVGLNSYWRKVEWLSDRKEKD